MAIRFQPTDFLKKAMPEKQVEKLVTQKLTLNRAAVRAIAKSDILTKKTVEKVALKVIKSYKATFKEKTLAETLNDKRLLVSRVQNAAVFEVSQEIKGKYEGEFYRWLPSDANEADPEHQLNYGKKFQLGVGEAPGDRYGCRCGMEILVSDSKLEL